LHFVLSILGIFSCFKAGNKPAIQKGERKIKVDTVITKSTILLLGPDKQELEEIKKKQGEDNFILLLMMLIITLQKYLKLLLQPFILVIKSLIFRMKAMCLIKINPRINGLLLIIKKVPNLKYILW
jgi:hypothetical protein